MLSTDPKTMNLIALAVAKIGYAGLSSISRHLGSDLELGLIGFAVVLRTRRDWFAHINEYGLDEDVLNKINSHKGYSTSIYEISNFTAINRATVRRKMLKLSDIGLIWRDEEDRWHLRDFSHGEPSRPALMLQEMLHSYVSITNALETLLPQEVDATRSRALESGVSVKPYALLEEEALEKERRGLAE